MEKHLIYPKAYVMQERGGKTCRVVTDLIKHASGQVTANQVARGLPREKALDLARNINSLMKRFPAQTQFRSLGNGSG